jgi:hypothetical protein
MVHLLLNIDRMEVPLNVSLEFEDLFLPLDFLSLGNLLSAMLVLVRFLVVFLSPCLLNYQLHCLDTQSHFRVHLYLNGMQMVMHKLTEANKLTKWIINAFLERQLADLNTHTAIRCSLLHGTRELLYDFLRELLIVVCNRWCILNTACILHFKKEDSCKCSIFLSGKIDLKNNANVIVGAKYPISLILSIVNLAWHVLVICLCEAAFHGCADRRAKEIPLETCEFVSNIFGAGLTRLSNLLICLSNFFRLLFRHSLCDLCKY